MTNIIPFKTSKVEGLFVSVPLDAMHLFLNMGYLAWKQFDKSDWITGGDILKDVDIASSEMKYLTGGTKLPSGNYSILCRLNDASEEQAACVVGKQYLKGDDEDYWFQYVMKDDELMVRAHVFCDTALESLQSLAKSLGAKDNDLILIKK